MLSRFYEFCNALHKQTYSQSYLWKKMQTLVKTKAKNTKTFDASWLRWIYIYMVFITEGFFEVAIESWPEWDLNPRPLNSDALTDWAIRPWVQLALRATLYSYSNFIVCSVSHFISAIAFISRHVCQRKHLIYCIYVSSWSLNVI